MPFSSVQNEHKFYLKRKRSFDDLLLPSLTLNTGPTLQEESPYFFDARKKSKTAPASPSGLIQITPTNSPVSSSNSLWSNNKGPKSPAKSSTSEKSDSCTKLPSLKHLKLLPNPKVQEYSYNYPDTSANTSLWRQNLTKWCKETDYNQYQNIVDQVSNLNPKAGVFSHGLNILADAARVSSIISSPDEFYELANSSNTKKLLVTPPSSPSAPFTSMISESLVNAVKKNRSQKHKKTNSFKARKLKKMLDERILLNQTEQFESQKSVFRASPIPTTPPQKRIALSSTPKSLQSPQRYHPIIINTNEQFAHKIAASDEDTDLEIAQLSPKSSPKYSPHRRNSQRYCVSCHSTDSPCWRPSWSNNKQDQLCNSCGLRYKKTHTRCTNDKCRKIPSKGELALMKSNNPAVFEQPDGTKLHGMSCLFCGHIVATD